MKWQQFIGLLLGLIGALGLISSGKDISLSNINSYAFFIVAATICYAVSINLVKTHLTHLKGVQIAGLLFLFIGPASLLFFFNTDIEAITSRENWSMYFLALLVLGIIGTAFAMLLMYSLIRYASAVFASSVTYIIPIFAIVWGIMDGELITVFYILFMGIIMLGVYLINRRS